LPYFDGIANIKDGRIIVRGIGLELLSKAGVLAADATHVKPYNPTVPNIEAFKRLADGLLMKERERLQVFYHSMACGVEMDGDRIGAVLIANKAGIVHCRAKTVIDCTGDADVAAWAGAPIEKSPELQPMTLHFRLGNVKKTPDFGKNCRVALEKARDRGELPMFYGPGLMFMFAPNELYIHGVRVTADGTDPADLTRAEIQGRNDAWTMFETWKREVPGFEDAYFQSAAPFIGVRETRRIVGQHVLTEEEIASTTRFDDAVASGCWYLDIHPNKTTLGSAWSAEKTPLEPYDIPYRSLLPQKVTNLLAAGRCHSATRGASGSTRVTVTAMALGEAAGLAAALAVKGGVSPLGLSGVEVRKALRGQNAGPAQDLG